MNINNTGALQSPSKQIKNVADTNPDLTGCTGKDVNALYGVFDILDNVLAGFLCQPRFDDGQNAAGKVLEHWAEAFGHVKSQLIQAAEQHPYCSEAASVVMRHELSSGSSMLCVSARAASLALDLSVRESINA